MTYRTTKREDTDWEQGVPSTAAQLKEAFRLSSVFTATGLGISLFYASYLAAPLAVVAVLMAFDDFRHGKPRRLGMELGKCTLLILSGSLMYGLIGPVEDYAEYFGDVGSLLIRFMVPLLLLAATGLRLIVVTAMLPSDQIAFGYQVPASRRAERGLNIFCKNAEGTRFRIADGRISEENWIPAMRIGVIAFSVMALLAPFGLGWLIQSIPSWFDFQYVITEPIIMPVAAFAFALMNVATWLTLRRVTTKHIGG